MTLAKIEFSLDNLRFSFEGDQDWAENQFNLMLDRLPALSKLSASTSKSSAYEDSHEGGKSESGTGRSGRPRKSAVAPKPLAEVPDSPLAHFLSEKNAEKNQVKKFLAVAVHLYSTGVEKFNTSMISKALKQSGIEKLLNASDCLNKNEKKGFCLKNGKEFVLTEEGFRSILGGAESAE